MSDDIERDRIFANDSDPTEELAELRRQEAEATDQKSEAEVEQEVEETPTKEAEETTDTPEPDDTGDEEEADSEPKEPSEDTTDTLYKFKADGQDFEFTQEEINAQFGSVFGKAMNYTRNLQELSPYRKMISALKEEHIDQDKLNLAIDLLKGDKGAIQKLIAEKDIDIYDLDSEEDDKNSYTGNDYGKNESELAIEEVNRQISGDPEYPQTIDIISNRWDENSRQALADNPEWISGLHSDVKSGVFAKVAPEAAKMKMLDGGSKPDIEYYLLAGQQLQDKQPAPVTDPVQAATQQFEKDSTLANKKRAATTTHSSSGSKSVVDLLDDNDEKFDEWYKGIMSQV